MKEKKLKLTNFKTIGSKFILSVSLIVILVMISTMAIVGKLSYDAVLKKSKEMASAKNEALANDIIGKYNTFYQLALDMSSRVNARMSVDNPNREGLDEIIFDAIKSNDLVVGSGIFFEPNTFDDKDANFANKKGYDKTGRISKYYYRIGTGDLIKHLEDTSNLDNEDWYKQTIQDGQSHFTEPYAFELADGSKVNMSTIVIPIKKGTRTIGIVTVDVDLEIFQRTLEQVSNEHTLSQLISFKGMMAGHGVKRENIMQNYVDIGGLQESVDKISKEEEFDIIQFSKTFQTDSFIKFTPIDFPYVTETWSISSLWSLGYRFNE